MTHVPTVTSSISGKIIGEIIGEIINEKLLFTLLSFWCSLFFLFRKFFTLHILQIIYFVQ